MKHFTSDLITKNIIMISDYVNPASYNKDEFAQEEELIRTFVSEISEYTKNFKYVEVKTLTDLSQILGPYNPKDTVVFNWCEFLEQREDTAQMITEFLEHREYIFTGADTRCLNLTGSKEETKKVLIENSIPTPRYKVIRDKYLSQDIGLNYPVIIKLENRHASLGITADNVVHNLQELNTQLSRLRSEFQSPVLAEEFIQGHEYAVTVWGNGPDAQILVCGSLRYLDENVSRIYTQHGKENTDSKDYQNTIIDTLSLEDNAELINGLSPAVLKSYQVLGFHDYGRFDVIVKDQKCYIIDCNPNEYIGPDSFLYDGSKQLGYNHGETLLQICDFAVKRYMQ